LIEVQAVTQDEKDFQKGISSLSAVYAELAKKIGWVTGQNNLDRSDLNIEERAKLIEKTAAEKALKEYEALVADMKKDGVSTDSIPASLHFDVGMSYFVLKELGKASDQLAACAEKRPQDPYILFNWGITLVKKYDTSGDVDWLQQALGKYEEAVAIKADFPNALSYWGLALRKMYDETQDIHQLEMANQKLSRASTLNPDLYRAYYIWGGCLATMYSATGKRRWLELAHQKCNRSIELASEGMNPYFNAACVLALMGKKDKMLDALKQSIKRDSIYKKIAREDEDLKAYWEDEDFCALVGDVED
jgi:tetratricopeptide (TPR) repeat protein